MTAENRYVEKVDAWSSHAWISRRIGLFPEATRLLDIGTATGMLGKRCADKGFVLHGIEPNHQWAEIARQYYNEFLCTGLDDALDTFLANHDVVILADVIEHMPFPETALQRLISLQPLGSVFIISVPNIANIWVRMNLLFGRFDYTDRGILDRTHLKFFTRKTFLEMLDTSGLVVKQFTVTPIPLNLVSPFFQDNRFGKAIFNALGYLTLALPTLLGYQLIAECRKL